MAVAIAIAVVEHNDYFLIGQRPPGVPLAGLWEFPGGKIHVDESETAEEAARRECLEETGIEVRVQSAYLSDVEQYDHGEVHLHFFACHPVPPVPEPRPPFRWVPRAELKRFPFPKGNRRLLQMLLADER